MIPFWKKIREAQRPRCTALVAAAGSSSRMGGENKLLLPLDGVPVLARTLQALERAQRVELLQSEIMDAYNSSLIGKTMEVLVDGFDEEYEQFYGRTYADSPEIDGRVWISSQEPLQEGAFVQVTIDGVQDGDLMGFAAEEESE